MSRIEEPELYEQSVPPTMRKALEKIKQQFDST